jgi:Cu-processing system ATP-binding protein
MYLQEGKMQFFKEIDMIREETGELKLGKAIARIMKGEDIAEQLINEIFKPR